MELHEKILEITTEEFRKKGLDFTMQEIAAAARISKKTIYTMYASKEALLLAMVEHGFRRIHEKKAAILAMELPLTEKIRRVMIALPDDYETLDFRMLTPLAEKYPSVADAVRRQLENNWEPTLALLREGIATGELRPINIPIVQLLLTAGVEAALSTNVLSSEGISYSDALDQMMDIIMNGICEEK